MQSLAGRKRQVSPQLPIGAFTSSDSSPSSGEQVQLTRQAYNVPKNVDNSRQRTGLPSQGQNIDQLKQLYDVARQEVLPPVRDAMVQGQVPSLIRGPIVQRPTATAYQQPILQRRIEAPASAQPNEGAPAGSILQTNVNVTRRLPGAGFRTTRYPNGQQDILTQSSSQIQQVPSSGTSYPSVEQTTRDRSVIEICRNEDRCVQERLVNRIEQAVLQLTNDRKTQSNRSNVVEQLLNQVLNTRGQTKTEEMPNVLRNLRQLRGDVNALMEGSSQSRRTVQVVELKQVTDVGGHTSGPKQIVQGRSYSIDDIVKSNKYSEDNKHEVFIALAVGRL